MTTLLVRPPAARPTRRRFTALLAAASAAAVALAGLVAAPSAQAASSTTESQFVSKINAARHDAGRRGLSTSSDLTTVARSWARRMAASNTLRHNPSLTVQVKGWRYVGENVGVGGDVSSLHRAFMGSAPHRANILDTDFTQVGVGTAWGNGRLWVVEVFRRPSSTASASRSHPVTHRKARTSHAKVYRMGSRGTVVKRIQRVVGVRADGIYGPRTRAAVMRWQKRHHYRVNGFVTLATRRAMHI